jgi:phytanoyl-CoA hydroxylase
VLDPALVSEASSHVAWLLRANPGTRPEQLGHTLMREDPFWVRLVSDERLLNVAEQFIGPDIALFASHYICKPPLDGQPVLWHQDGAYWPLEPMEVVSLWLAVDDSLPENGCLRVIPGTHRSKLAERQDKTDVPNVLGSTLADSVDEASAVDVIVRAGGVSVHHPNLVHGSNGNRSPRRRCGLTIRYIPATTRIKHAGRWPSAFFLRGRKVPERNSYLSWPEYIPGRHMAFAGCETWNDRRNVEG